MGTGKVDLSQLKLFEFVLLSILSIRKQTICRKHELEVKLEGGDSAEESMGHLVS